MFFSLFWLSLTTCLLTTVSCQSQARCMFQETLYGRFIHPCKNFEGESCQYSCYSNFNPPTVISTTTVTCTSSGSWTGNLDCSDPVVAAATTVDPNEPVIIQQPIYPKPSSGVPSPESRTCPAVENFENGVAHGFCRTAKNGNICSFRCNEGFQLKGVKKLKCMGEAWNDELPVCQELGPGSEECRPLVLPPRNGSLSGACKIPLLGSVCSLTCDPGFYSVGESRLTCTTKGWTNENPRCVDMSCKKIISPENGYVVGDCDPGVVGNFCAFACKKGYALVGPSIRYCNYKGIWDPAEQATCYPLASCGLNPPSTTTIESSSLPPPQPTTQTSSNEQPEATTETLTTAPQTTPQTVTETTPIVVSQSSSSAQPESLTQTPPVVASQPTSMQQPETETISTIVPQTSEQPEVLTQTPSIIVSQTPSKQYETQATPVSQMTSSEEPEYLTQTVADSEANHSHTEADTSQWEIISDVTSNVTTQIYPTGHPIRETKRRGRIETTENNILFNQRIR